MQLSSNKISRPTPDELRLLRVEKLGGDSTQPVVLTGTDGEGHTITPISVDNVERPEKLVPTNGEGITNSSSSVQQVSSLAEQVEQELQQEIAVARQFEDSLKTWLNMAPMMGLLRACDMINTTPEFEKIALSNRNIKFENANMILNNGEPPIRIAIPDPLDSSRWTSIVPPLIPAGIRVSVPKEGGESGWEQLETPNREPSAEENQEIRKMLQDAFILLYGREKGENKISQKDQPVTFIDISSAFEDVDPEAIALTEHAIEKESFRQDEYRQQADQMLARGRQHLESPYLDFLNLLSSSAEFVARGTSALVGATGMAFGQGMLEESVEGAQAVEKFIEEKAPVVSLIRPLTVLPILAGFYVGATVGVISSFPESIKKSCQYFSVHQTLSKIVSAATQLVHGAENILSLMEEANQADEKIKKSLEKSFETFQELPSAQSKRSPEFQDLIAKKNLLIHQIDQRIDYRSKSIKTLKDRITQKRKEQEEYVIPTSGPRNRTRIRL